MCFDRPSTWKHLFLTNALRPPCQHRQSPSAELQLKTVSAAPCVVVRSPPQSLFGAAPACSMAHTAVYVWQRLIEKGAAFKEINLLVSEIYKLMDRFLEHHESASRILRDAAQDIAEGGPSGRRTARQETLGCYVFPSCHTDDDLEARRAYGTAVRRASTRGAILLATSLAEVVIRCHDARSPALAAVLRSVIRPRLAELMTAPGPAAEVSEGSDIGTG